MLKIKALSIVFLLSSFFSAHADIILNHNQGTASIGDISLKVVSINGKVCFKNKTVSKLTPRVVVTTEELESREVCKDETQFRVYGILTTFGFFNKAYYSDRFVAKNDTCNIIHSLDGYFSSKLIITCD
jgi:hypothetical protein